MSNDVVPREEKELVVRSEVPAGLPYRKYRNYLRYDFFHSCGYCTISEAEASAIRFTIDHYEPQNSRADLVNEYGNLIWACDTCNTYKGDLCPPPVAREKGHRIFRPDEDLFLENFARDGSKLKELTTTGWFSIEALDLNRESLQRLRELRSRLSDCEEHITAGILALRSFGIDRLPNHLRSPAARSISSLISAHGTIVAAIESVLRQNAASLLIDDDGTAELRQKSRAAKLKATEALYPGGDWRARRKKRKR